MEARKVRKKEAELHKCEEEKRLATEVSILLHFAVQCRVVWQMFTDISEDPTAFILRQLYNLNCVVLK
jgi:hypothetical protein